MKKFSQKGTYYYSVSLIFEIYRKEKKKKYIILMFFIYLSFPQGTLWYNKSKNKYLFHTYIIANEQFHVIFFID